MKKLTDLGFAPCVAADLNLSAAQVAKIAAGIAAGLCPIAALVRA